MTSWMRAPRAMVLLGLVLVIWLTSLTLTNESATGGPQPATDRNAPTTIAVVGDSITARYDDEAGSDRQGWWSMVARHYGSEVRTFAQSGSGYLRRGHACTGSTFGDRLNAALLPQRPSLLIVEGGRNDWSYCDHGVIMRAPDAMIATAVDRYLDAISALVGDGTRVLVVGPPWGPLGREDRARVTTIIRAAADEHGFQFVSMDGAFDASRVVDGVHPNRSGSQAVARRVIRAIDSPA